MVYMVGGFGVIDAVGAVGKLVTELVTELAEVVEPAETNVKT